MTIEHNRLIFPSGRPVYKVKQDAKILKKKNGISLKLALDLCAKDNGLDTNWELAINFLKDNEIASARVMSVPVADILMSQVRDGRKLNRGGTADLMALQYLTPNSLEKMALVEPDNESQVCAISFDKYAVGCITLFDNGELWYDAKASDSASHRENSNGCEQSKVSIEVLAAQLLNQKVKIHGASIPTKGMNPHQKEQVQYYTNHCTELGQMIIESIRDSSTQSDNG